MTTRQAGLLPMEDPAAPAQAGLTPPPLTMADRASLVDGMVRQGMPYSQIMTQLRAMGLADATEEVAPPPAGDIGYGTILKQGARDLARGTVAGTGLLAERALGVDGAREAAAEAGEDIFGLTEEEAEARARRAEEQGFWGEVGDAVVGSVPTLAPAVAGGVVGAAALGTVGQIGGGIIGGLLLGPPGAAAGAVAGRAGMTKLGAWIGAATAITPAMIDNASKRAVENGLDPSKPEVQDKIIATGVARAALESFGIEAAASKLLGPATNAARRAVARSAAKGAGKYAAIEGAAEVAGELLEISVFDPEVRAQLGEAEVSSLVPYVAEKYGREIAVSFAAGVILGGTVGAGGVAFQQNRINAQRKRDVEALQAVAEKGGVDTATLEAAATDPERAPELAQAARDIGQVRREVETAKTILDGTIATGDASAITEAQARFESVLKRADETYDRVMAPFGALTTKQIETREEMAAQRARDTLVAEGVATPDAVKAMARSDASAYARDLSEAQTRVQEAEAALTSGAMFDSEARTQAQQEARAAKAALQKTKDTIAIKTGKETAESVRQKAETAAETEAYTSAVERQYARKFAPLVEAGKTEEAKAEAQRIVDAAAPDGDKGLRAAITKLEKQLDEATTVDQIDKLEAEIAAKRARLGREAPIVAAARRLTGDAGPQQAGAEAQGSSPATAGQSAAPEATPATATPESAPDTVATAPAAPEGASAAPAAIVTPEPAPSGAPGTAVDPETALARIDQSVAERVSADPADAIAAAPLILQRGTEARTTRDMDIDTSPSDAWRSGMPWVQLGAERSLASALGLPVNATPAQMWAAYEATRAQTPATEATPAPTRAQTPATEAAPAPTRERARAERQAEVETETTQQRLDREHMQGKAPTFDATKREGFGGDYVDMLDIFGRRTTTRATARTWVAEQAAKTGYEYYVAYDRETGEVLGAGTNNRPNEVYPSKASIDRLKAGGKVDIIHNHPSGRSLSVADISFLYAMKGDARIIALAPDGFEFAAEPTELGRKMFGSDAKGKISRAIGPSQVRQIYNSVGNALWQEGLVGTTEGRPDPTDLLVVLRSVTRAANRAMAQEGLIQYKETGRPQDMTSRERVAYDRGVKDARQAIRNAFSLPAGRSKGGTRSRSGTVQRSRGVRPERSSDAGSSGGDQGAIGDGGGRLADSGGRPASERSDVAAGRRGGGRGGPVARQPRADERVAGLTPTRVFDTTGGTAVYEVTNPERFTELAEAGRQTMGPVGAQVGTDAGTRQFLIHDGRAGFALDGDNIISVFTSEGAPGGVMDAVLELGVAEGGRRLDAFDTFLPQAYARRGFRAVARLPFNREYAPDGWDYDFFMTRFGNSDPDVVFMVYDPDGATPDTDNTISDYGDGEAAQQAALAETPGALQDSGPDLTWSPSPAEVRTGRDIDRSHPWRDVSTDLPANVSPEQADAFVAERGGTKVEYLVATRADGSVLAAGTNNHSTGVQYSQALQHAMTNNIGPIRITHNHPFKAALSALDVLAALRSRSPAEVVAMMPDGSRNIVRKGPAAQTLNYREMAEMLDAADSAAYELASPRSFESKRATAIVSEARNRALQRAGLIEYEWDNGGPGFTRDIDNLIEGAADGATERLLTRLRARDDGSSPDGQGAGGADGALGNRGSGRSGGMAATPGDRAQAETPRLTDAARAASDTALQQMTAPPSPDARRTLSQRRDPQQVAFEQDSALLGDNLPEDVVAEIETLRRNKEAFKASRPDLHAAVLDAEGQPIVVWHGTLNPNFTEQRPQSGLIFAAASPKVAGSYGGQQAGTARYAPRRRSAAEMIEDAALLARVDLEAHQMGRFVSMSIANEILPENSLWKNILFGPEAPVGAMSGDMSPISNAALDAAVEAGVLTPEQVTQIAPAPYYRVFDISGTDLLPDQPYAPAGEAFNRILQFAQARGIDLQSEYRGGKLIPAMLDMSNPFVTDFGGRNWNNPPPDKTIAEIWYQADSYYDFDPIKRERIELDWGMFPDGDAAQAAAMEWVDTKRAEFEAAGIDPDLIGASVRPEASYRSTDQIAAMAREEGYDGVIFRNITDPGPKGGGGDITDVYVVYEPEQFKHALDNDGTFDSTDPNFLSDSPQMPEFEPTVRRFPEAEARARIAVQVPAWMDVKTQQGAAYADMLARAKQPASAAKSILSSLERQIINRLAPIRDREIALKGALLEGMDSAFKSAEIAVNDPGRNEALLFYGAAELGPNGEFRTAHNTIGIRPMLAKLGKGQAIIDWMDYMGARRAREIQAKGFETPLTEKDIAAGLAKETPLFKEVAADWKRFNDANVDFLVKTGRISPGLAATLKADAAYIPFYRSDATVNDTPDLFDDAGIRDAARMSRSGGQLLARDPGIKKLTGGKTRKVNNLVENMIRNSQAIVAAGMRNRAANLTFDMLTQAGDVQVMPARVETKEGKYVAAPKPDNAVRMWRNGREQYVVPTTPDAVPVILAMAGMQPVRLNGIAAAMAAVGSFFRQSITLSPSFVIRNMLRDAVSTGVLFGGRNLTMKRNMVRGFRESLRKGANRQAFSAMSGMGDFRFGGGDIGLGKDDVMIELGITKPSRIGALGYRFRKVVDAMEQLGTASELSNRLAVYEALVAEGVRPDEAAYQALTIVNYSRKGANEQLQTLLPLVPFLNARIQGLARLGEDVVARRGKDRQQALARLAISGAVLATVSALLWGWNHQDEERRAQYNAEPLHRRLNYHILYLGDRKVMIPKAFEIGTLFSTTPELLMQGLVGGDTSEIGPAMVQTLTNTFGFNPIPQAMLPALELLTDYNFFTGRPIEGTRLRSLMREDRVNPQTTALAIGLARAGLGDFTGLSPVAIDHLLAGYGGIAYTSLATMVDTVAGEMGLLPARPDGVFGNIPVVSPALETTFRSMFKQRDADPANRWVEDFYDTRNSITQIYRSARDAALAGDVERAKSLLATAPATPAAYSLMNKAGTQMGELNSAIRQIRADPSMPGDEKRRKLDALVKERNRLATKVMEIIREAEERQGTSFSRAA